LSPPERDGTGTVDRDIGQCFYRRAPSTPDYVIDGTAHWSFRNVRRTLRPLIATGPLVDAVSEDQPNTGDNIELSLQGASFPPFAVRAAMPSELVVNSHTSGTMIPYPPQGQPLVVEWAVPTAPSSVRIGINWNNAENLYCIIPATQGRFVMEEPLLQMFRDATTAQLVVSHAQVQRVLVGNRSLRFVVERLSLVARFAR
jgi:hypothetical protein